MRLPPRKIDCPPPADPLVIDAAELHRARLVSLMGSVWVWWDVRCSRNADPENRALYRQWVRDAVRDLRSALSARVPESDPMIRIEPWQLDREMPVSHLPSRLLVDRLRLQESVCRILARDSRCMQACDVRDRLKEEAARRFAGLYEPRILALAA